MDALHALLTRRSVVVPNLTAPGPGQDQIDAAIDAALRAPDHGQLRPARFVLIHGEARARLSALFVRCMQEREPPPPPGKIDKARRNPLTAPLVIAVGAHIIAQHKVPEIEQLLSVGASVMGLLAAFHVQGFGAIWLTGDNAYDRRIADALEFGDNERCLGFVYVGSIVHGAHAPPPARIARTVMVRNWTG